MIKVIKTSIYHLMVKTLRWGQIQSNLKLITQEILVVGKYTYGVENLNIKIYKGSEAKVYIGNFCSLGQNITIITGGIHPTNWISTYPLAERFKNPSKRQEGMPSTKGNIYIGNDVWIAENCTILSGVKIGNGAVIATGSVVTKDVPDFSIVGGIPARVLRFRFQNKEILELNELKWWDWDREKILKNIDLLSSMNLDKFLLKHKKNSRR